ncbi:ataxin-7-like protein 1 [Arapaima gigas]
MATLDRELPTPDMFVYERCSAHADGDKTRSSDNMHFCGQHPTSDDTCFLERNLCIQITTSQGFQTHCGSRRTDAQ